VAIWEGDVAELLRQEASSFDAILLDVDNGPRALTRPANRWLYSRKGLQTALGALRPGGVLALWSAGPQPGFTPLPRQAGFAVAEKRVRSQGPGSGGFHTVWVCRRPPEPDSLEAG
jgi:hypothetical protein